jgi:hypothetical protein
MCETDIFEGTGCEYRNTRRPIMHDKLQMYRLVPRVHEICSFMVNEATPLCTKAKEEVCQAIEAYACPNVKNCADIVDLFGKEDIDFLGC